MENEIRSKYDSLVVYLYNTNREHILPKEFRQTIPYTTISNWRKTNYRSFKGSEYREKFEEAFLNAELQQENKRMKAGLRNLVRSWSLLRAILTPVIKKAGSDKKQQRSILRAIEILKCEIGTEKALRFLGISLTQYHEWVIESRYSCWDSFTSLCTKRHPHQLQMKEVIKIKKMLMDPEMDHWPICSIASHGFRKGTIVASLGTWYKYARIFGVTKQALKSDKKKIGLEAKEPNEYLHVDTTEFNLLVGKEVFITFVQDNFSKMILGYSVTDKLSFRQVELAVQRALEVIEKHPVQRDSVLVVDGGSENHHKKLNEFFSKISGRKVTKVTALKQIKFSNSSLEALNKIMKSRYLRRKKFMELDELERYLGWAIKDYNELRPHYKHMPRTPFEAYFDIPLKFNVKTRMSMAKSMRVFRNKLTHCSVCQGDSKNCGTNSCKLPTL